MLEVQHLIIALVEPSPVQSHIISTVFQELGIDQIRIFHTGQELLDSLEKDMPDVVVSAFYLPDMDGSDLVYRLRGDERTSLIPFILISSETNPYYLDPIRQAGAMALLPKPFDVHQLDKALNNVLDFLNAEPEQHDEEGDEYADLVVLIVDDSLTARRHVRTILEKIGFEKIIEARTGLEAIPLLEQHLFDLVFTDYNMPQMDGRALVEHIRTKTMQGSVPILMVSSESDQGRLSAVEDAGVSAICDKPFGTELVRQLVRKFVTERR